MGDNIKTTICEIQCVHCRRWFRSEIFLGDSTSYDGVDMSGNTVECTLCRKMTPSNKENMRYRADDHNGHVVHEVGKDTKGKL